MWSGMTTMASMLKGRDARTVPNAPRKVSTASAEAKTGRRACVTRVKKKVPPGVKARRYSRVIL
jgi:hypothetical protein